MDNTNGAVHYMKGDDVWTNTGRKYKIIQVKKNEIMIKGEGVAKNMDKKYIINCNDDIAHNKMINTLINTKEQMKQLRKENKKLKEENEKLIKELDSNQEELFQQGFDAGREEYQVDKEYLDEKEEEIEKLKKENEKLKEIIYP